MSNLGIRLPLYYKMTSTSFDSYEPEVGSLDGQKKRAEFSYGLRGKTIYGLGLVWYWDHKMVQ